MAVRREQVILDLQDNLTPGLARAAVAAGLLDRELKSLGGSSVRSGRDLDTSAKSVDKIGASSRRAGPEVDHMAGRMRIMADAALTLGPALIPLGASTIPVLTSALAGMGAAAGAIGVTVLAFKGIGAGLKALDKAQLEPTAANLHALRLEMEKLGPAGAEFIHFLDGIEPQLKSLQDVARKGIFPGVEAGITDLLTRLPEVRKIVNRLSQGMGDLARDAGASLSSDAWTPFFNYLKTDARPTLEAFGHATGNVALGLSNMLVAFAPLSRDFTGGLEDATKAFADWSAGLADNQSFQDFIDYIRESGPQVLDFLSALGGALSGLLQAAAPFGQIVLPALTGMAKAFALIAKSPIGPGLYTAAAGMIAFNRAASIASKTSDRFAGTWSKMNRETATLGGIGLLVTQITDLDDKAGLANTAMLSMAGLMVGGPWGLAVGAAVGQYQDLNAATAEWTDNVKRADDALQSGNPAELTAQLANLQEQYDKLLNDVPDNPVSFLDTLFTPSKLQGNNEAMKAYADRIAEIKVKQQEGGDVADLFAESIGRTGDQLRIAAGDAQSFSGALAVLNGWFDKRAAVRNYKDAIDDLAKGLKNGFTREDSANVDALGQSILQVAQNIKSPKVRGDFLASARAQLVDMAEHSGPKAAAALQEIVDKFDDKGLTHPKITPEVDDTRARAATAGLAKHVKGQVGIMSALAAHPTIDANDNPFQQTYGSVKAAMAQADRLRARPQVDVDPGNSQGILGSISSLLTHIDGFHAKSTISVTTIRNSVGGGAVPPAQSADGGTVPRSGRPYADRFPYLLADGEEVISNRFGQADRHRSLLKAINAGRMADGGTAAQTHTTRTPTGSHLNIGGGAFFDLSNAASGAATGLKGLKKQLDATQKAFDKAKQTRDAAVTRRDSLSSTIQSNLAGGSIWDASSGSVWAAGAHGANTPQGAIATLNERKDRAQRFVAALNTLKTKGVTGAALQEILSEGLEATEAMAAADLGTLSQFSAALNGANSALAAAGLAGGNAVEGANVTAANKRLDRIHDDLQTLTQAVNQANNDNKQGLHDNAVTTGQWINGTASNGHRRGKS